jgi:hypothetical protein
MPDDGGRLVVANSNRSGSVVEIALDPCEHGTVNTRLMFQLAQEGIMVHRVEGFLNVKV